jgi:hypothetical protein
LSSKVVWIPLFRYLSLFLLGLSTEQMRLIHNLFYSKSSDVHFHLIWQIPLQKHLE